MPQDANGARRGPDGKFLPGHKPPKSPGRPPGPNGVKARASRIASERLEQMLGKAAEVVDEALNEGDTHVATWLIDRVRPPGRSDYLQLTEIPKPTTIEGIITTSESIVHATANGEISLQNARALQDILERHAAFTGLEELTDLRANLDKLRIARNQPAKPNKSHFPTWGRLRESSQ